MAEEATDTGDTGDTVEEVKDEKVEVEEKEEAAQADSTEDYKKAAELKTKECSLMEQIDELNRKLILF